MKRQLPMMLLACCSNLLPAQTPDALLVKEYILDNGLTVWLNKDHSQPKVFGAIVVKAGAKDCPDTGIAHYFEHIMFKGTDKIGTINYEAEKVLLDSIATKYDELAATTDTKIRAVLQKEINELSIRSSDYVIPNEFNRLISRFGGTGLNAGTSYDATVYFNAFSPQYLEQWAEINSERLLNPVFRLFQSELETVYEEKNMYGDFIGGQAMEKLLTRYFAPHPYAYPIIGSTKNLKNPRLTAMQQFFDDYYVASNMGLILSGDFEEEALLPILEKTFSRIRKGNAPERVATEVPPFHGKEKMKVKIPIPFLKIMGLGFRGVPANHKDQVALNIAVSLLNNANGTGYLDKLMVDHKVMASMAMNESMNEAGILAIAIIPKLMFQTCSGAEKLAWKEINRVKNGDFTEETFSSLKLEQKRKYASALENVDSRAMAMMNLFSQGKSWNDYLEEVAKIDALTKEDIVHIARKYFANNYLFVTKSTGKYPKDNLPKPDFAPVIPKNAEASSEYSKQLESIPVRTVKPRFIDFKKDISLTELTPLVQFYATANPLNDIFTFTISYGTGTLEQPMLSQLAGYIQFLGTESLSFEAFRTKLQVLGSTLSVETDDNNFIIRVTGFDNHFNETLALTADFIEHVKADDKKMRQMVDDAKVTRKAFFQSNDNMAQALLEKVKYGNESRYLKQLSLSEVKKLKGQKLLDLFAKVRRTECSIHYCGTLNKEEVATQIKQHVPLGEINQPSLSPFYREPISYEKPVVYFIDMPQVSQSIVYSYVKGDKAADPLSRCASNLFAGYFGGDMSSLMFQEIREYRSFAYRVKGRYTLPPLKRGDKHGDFVTMLSTQNDKTSDAMTILDSLIRQMPVKPERMDAVKQFVTNSVTNDFPPFRTISERAAYYRQSGFDGDPSEALLNTISCMDMKDVFRFYEQHVSSRPVVYVIAGNEKQIDLKKLSSFGTIVKVKKKDIYK